MRVRPRVVLNARAWGHGAGFPGKAVWALSDLAAAFFSRPRNHEHDGDRFTRGLQPQNIRKSRTKRRKNLHLFFVKPGVALMIALTVALPAAAESIKVGGNGGALGLMGVLREAFSKIHPNQHVEIVHGLGSAGGRKALKAGALDVAVTSKPWKELEKTDDLISHLYGRAPLVIAVRQDNPVTNFTTKDIVDIYSGKSIYWPNRERIRVILRPLTDTESELLKSIDPQMVSILMKAHQRGGMTIRVDDSQAADALETTAGAMGTSTLSLILAEKRALRAVPLDKIVPSKENMAQGSYRLFKSFFISTRAQASPDARLFVDFVLSPEAKPILESLGHWVP